MCPPGGLYKLRRADTQVGPCGVESIGEGVTIRHTPVHGVDGRGLKRCYAAGAVVVAAVAFVVVWDGTVGTITVPL